MCLDTRGIVIGISAYLEYRMGKQPGEITPAEAAAILGYRGADSVMNLVHSGRLSARSEVVGVFGRRRYWLDRAEVEQLRERTREGA